MSILNDYVSEVLSDLTLEYLGFEDMIRLGLPVPDYVLRSFAKQVQSVDPFTMTSRDCEAVTAAVLLGQIPPQLSSNPLYALEYPLIWAEIIVPAILPQLDITQLDQFIVRFDTEIVNSNIVDMVLRYIILDRSLDTFGDYHPADSSRVLLSLALKYQLILVAVKLIQQNGYSIYHLFNPSGLSKQYPDLSEEILTRSLDSLPTDELMNMVTAVMLNSDPHYVMIVLQNPRVFDPTVTSNNIVRLIMTYQPVFIPELVNSPLFLVKNIPQYFKHMLPLSKNSEAIDVLLSQPKISHALSRRDWVEIRRITQYWPAEVRQVITDHSTG